MSRSPTSQKLHRIEAAEYLSQCHKTDDYKQYNGRNSNQKIWWLFLLFFRHIPPCRSRSRLRIRCLRHNRGDRYFVYCIRYRNFINLLCRYLFCRFGHGCFPYRLSNRLGTLHRLRYRFSAMLGHGCFPYRLRGRLGTLCRLNRFQLFSTVCAEPESFTHFFSTIRTFCHVFSPFKQARTSPAFSPVL